MEHTVQRDQVLAYADAYVRSYGCLPTAREVARGCGFGGHTTADRLMRELEADGSILRDPMHSRLGSVVVSGATQQVPPSIDDQLFLCEVSRIEYRSILLAIRSGLDLTDDVATILELHREGATRATVLRAYDDARERLVGAGAQLSDEDLGSLDDLAAIMSRRQSFLTDWPSFCLVRMVWNLSAVQWLRTLVPAGLGYLGSGYAASHRASASVMSVIWERAEPHFGTHPHSDRILAEATAVMREVRAFSSRRFPTPADVTSLDLEALMCDAPRAPRQRVHIAGGSA